jgi:hypothetical protein
MGFLYLREGKHTPKNPSLCWPSDHPGFLTRRVFLLRSREVTPELSRDLNEIRSPSASSKCIEMMGVGRPAYLSRWGGMSQSTTCGIHCRCLTEGMLHIFKQHAIGQAVLSDSGVSAYTQIKC